MLFHSLLACTGSSIIPGDSADPVDKLAGHGDDEVRLGTAARDVFGLVRAPEHDNYGLKLEAYVRPGEQTKWESTTYFVRDGSIESILVEYTPGRQCSAELGAMNQLAGSPTTREEKAGLAVSTWQGARSHVEVIDTGPSCRWITSINRD